MPYFLKRQPSTDDGTLGELLDNEGQHICYTIELPWKDNEPQVSCIPTGTYQVILHDTPAHPHTWEITNVPDRQAILIHNGNTENDVKGCVAVGSEIGEIDGLPAVLNSNATLKKLREILPLNFTLTVEQ